MTQATATRLGPYAIVSRIGAGGMGTVYRATDTRLGRTVALKIVRADADTPARRQRFEREARAASQLNHPHICAIHDVGEDNGVPFLVMEYLEGETLANRLRRGPLPVSEVLRCAIEIADALDHAHSAGLIHRDLKPANVMLTRAGTKLLDFGVARWRLDSASDQARDPDETLTEDGTIVGTLQYMSPEQLEGATVDARSDIFSFGALIYEMATGRAAFDGPSRRSVMTAVLEHDPLPLSAAVSARDETVPPLLDQIVARCLAKDPEDRWQTARDLRHPLQWIADGATATTVTGATGTRASHGSRRRAYLACGLAVFLVAVLATVYRQRVAPEPVAPSSVLRTTILLPPTENLSRRFNNDYPLALSSDGMRLAYVAAGVDREQLYVRDLSELDAKPIAGTAGARHPFFSPDGKWIAFFTGGVLQKAPVAGGPPIRICESPGVSIGGSWAADETIVFAVDRLGLFRVSANGGTARRLDGSDGARWPEVLPDGKTVLFSTADSIRAASLAGAAPRVIARRNNEPGEGPAVLGEGAIAQVRYLPTGHLVYGQDPGAIRAVSFDASSLTVTGSPLSLIDGVYRSSNSGSSVYFAVSKSGLLVYSPENQRRSLVWVDRAGRVTPIGSDRESFRVPRLSPDGRRIAVAFDDELRRADIWIYDAVTGTRMRLTSQKHNLAIVWTPDGSQVAHSSNSDLVLDSANGGGVPRVLVQDRPEPLRGRSLYSSSWSPDGRDLIFWTQNSVTGQDLWIMRDDEPRPLLTSAANEKFGQLSPDGKWIAYQSDESGRDEVYVARYPSLSSRTAVSNRGGGYPVWSSDGRELFYRQATAMMAASVETSTTFRASAPRLLFDDPAYVGTSGDLRFDVSRDGQRFVTPRADDATVSRQLVLVHNWHQEVKRRLAEAP
jgi:serine/threonine-protein kinase